MSDVLEAGQFGLVVVAINPKGTDVEALLANAVAKVVAVERRRPRRRIGQRVRNRRRIETVTADARDLQQPD